MPPISHPASRQFLFALCLQSLVKLLLAAQLPLFGDEAFYWQESRALAWSYTDVPPLTALLIAFGTTLGGDSLLGLRWLFLVQGALLPLLLWAWSWRREQDAAVAARVGGYALALPLAGLNGILALPDVPLTLAMLAAFVVLDRALDAPRGWHGWALGAALALALLAHWRGALLVSAGLLLMLISPRMRRALRWPGWWLVLLIGALALLPTLIFNAQHDWAALRFQVLERHPWRFQLEGLWIPLEQALSITPALALLMLAVVHSAWQRRRAAPQDLMVASALGIVVVYLLLGFFADNTRTRVHWPLPGYLPILLLLPALERRWLAVFGWRHWLARAALPMAALAQCAVIGVLAAAGSADGRLQARAAQVIGKGFRGFEMAAAEARQQLRRLPADSLLIADNFLLAAELDFAFGGRRAVYVLDHPRNRKHGRQAQLAIWRRDQASLPALPWSQALLVIEESARYADQRLMAWQALCDQFGRVTWGGERAIGESGSHFLFLVVSKPSLAAAADCAVPLIAYLNTPLPNQVLGRGEDLLVSGWAIRDHIGIASVRVLVDGVASGLAELRLPAAYVLKGNPSSLDPQHPNVGFRALIPAANLSPGAHRVEIEVSDGDGMQRRFGPRLVSVQR